MKVGDTVKFMMKDEDGIGTFNKYVGVVEEINGKLMNVTVMIKNGKPHTMYYYDIEIEMAALVWENPNE